jgi:chromosomal replication initiation ATPase DnaA
MRTLKEIADELLAKYESMVVEPTPAERETRRQLEREEALKARSREFVARGMPRRVADIVVSGRAESTAALRAAKAWWGQRERTILVLSGPRGCGKTVAAGWVCAQESNAEFLPASQLARIGLYDEQRFRALRAWRVLVLDDLGLEYSDQKGAFLSLLDALVDARSADESRTVITTNLPSQEFVMRYGERIADRMREAGLFVEIADASLRGRS